MVYDLEYEVIYEIYLLDIDFLDFYKLEYMIFLRFIVCRFVFYLNIFV